jgi:hypothetical protein
VFVCSLPVKTTKELVALARAKAGQRRRSVIARARVFMGNLLFLKVAGSYQGARGPRGKNRWKEGY